MTHTDVIRILLVIRVNFYLFQVTSISYTILCIIALIYRFNCDVAAPETSDNAQFTWHTIYKIYIQGKPSPIRNGPYQFKIQMAFSSINHNYQSETSSKLSYLPTPVSRKIGQKVSFVRIFAMFLLTR